PAGGRLTSLVKRMVNRLTRWQLNPLVAQINDLRAQMIEEGIRPRRRLERELAELRASFGAQSADVADAIRSRLEEAGREEGAESKIDLGPVYEAHQARFRGSVETIRERLETYVPEVVAA